MADYMRIVDGELEVIRASDIKIRPRWDESKWNGWRLHGSCLSYPAYQGGGRYPFDVRDYTRSSRVLDIIVQVARKTWATDACIAGLVHALDHILEPQANLCSGGSDLKMTQQQIKERLKRRPKRKRTAP